MRDCFSSQLSTQDIRPSGELRLAGARASSCLYFVYFCISFTSSCISRGARIKDILSGKYRAPIVFACRLISIEMATGTSCLVCNKDLSKHIGAPQGRFNYGRHVLMSLTTPRSARIVLGTLFWEKINIRN